MSRVFRDVVLGVLLMIVAVAIASVTYDLYVDFRSVTKDLSWDAPPAPLPEGYRIYVDRRLVSDAPTPPITEPCHCFYVKVKIPRGLHVVEIVAYNTFSGERIDSPPARLRVTIP
jgi:hypothetical protein